MGISTPEKCSLKAAKTGGHSRNNLGSIGGGPVSLYFFTIRDSDRRVKVDPHGIDLPNAADALSYAERRIIELRHELGYDNPQLIMMVQDEYRHTVWSVPFLPACA
jgi:Domain of unknown function (DUF6894)